MTKLEIMKECYSLVSEFTFFLDNDFNIIWYNSSSQFPKECRMFCVEYIALIIKNSSGESGVFFDTCSNCDFSYSVSLIKNDSNEETEYYIVQVRPKGNILSANFHKIFQKNFVYNSAYIRQAIFSMCNSLINIYDNIKEPNSSISSFNIIMLNCYKIIKITSEQNELFKYLCDMPNFKNINVYDFITDINCNLRNIFREFCAFNVKSEKDIFIDIDEAHLTFLVLEMINNVLENNTNKSNDIFMSAIKSDDSILISVSTSSDVNLYELIQSRAYQFVGNDEPLHFQILTFFCKCFNASAYIKSGEDYTACIKLPSVSEPEQDILLSSEKASYSQDRFSLYHIILSEKMGYDFFK